MEYLPDIIVENILFNLAPDGKCLIDDFIKLKLVCKRWNDIINHYSFWKRYCSTNYYFIKDICQLTDFEAQKIKYKQFLKIKHQQEILKYHMEYIFYNQYNNINFVTMIIILGGVYNFSKLQYIDISWRLPSMLYSISLEYDFFDEFKKKMKGRIARGLDNKNRPFISFKYYDNHNDEYITEIIYRNNFNEWTYMGDMNKTYIGLQSHENRELSVNSYNYIERLLLNKPCGFIFYDKNQDNNYILYESYKSYNNINTVSLFTKRY